MVLAACRVPARCGTGAMVTGERNWAHVGAVKYTCMLLEVSDLRTEFAPRHAPAVHAVRGVSFGIDKMCIRDRCKKEFDQNPQLWVSVSHAEMTSAQMVVE